MGEWLDGQAAANTPAGVNRIDTVAVVAKVGANAPAPAGTSGVFRGGALDPATWNKEALVGLMVFFLVAGLLWRATK